MKGLVDAWHSSRQERTWMKPGERVHSIEGALQGRMPIHRILDGVIPHRREREPNDEGRYGQRWGRAHGRDRSQERQR